MVQMISEAPLITKLKEKERQYEAALAKRLFTLRAWRIWGMPRQNVPGF